MDTKDRIKQYLDLKGVSDYRFEKELSLSKGYVNKAKNPTSDVLTRMCGVYTDISAEWLLRGEGEILKPSLTAKTDLSDSSLVEDLKAEINQLKGENRVLREQLGLGERKESKHAS